jgi:hypothetical protein
LKSLKNKLPDYVRTQWAFFVNERDIEFPSLERFLDWINIQININSVVDSAIPNHIEENVNVTLKTSIVKKGNEIKSMVMATEKDELQTSTTNQYESNYRKIKENRVKIERRILNAEYAIQVNTN